MQRLTVSQLSWCWRRIQTPDAGSVQVMRSLDRFIEGIQRMGAVMRALVLGAAGASLFDCLSFFIAQLAEQ